MRLLRVNLKVSDDFICEESEFLDENRSPEIGKRDISEAETWIRITKKRKNLLQQSFVRVYRRGF